VLICYVTVHRKTLGLLVSRTDFRDFRELLEKRTARIERVFEDKALGEMPRSFLITKLHTRKDGDVADDETLNFDDDDVADTCTGSAVVDDQMTQIQGYSKEYSDVDVMNNAVSDKSDGENSLTDFIGTSPITFTTLKENSCRKAKRKIQEDWEN